MNVKTIIDDLTYLGELHKQINSVAVGDTRQLNYLLKSRDGESNDPENIAALYPLFFISPQTVNTNARFKTINFNCMVLDILSHDYNADSEIEIFSDTDQIADDIISAIKFPKNTYKFLNDYDITLPTTKTFVSERYDDYVSGVMFTLQVQVPVVVDRCDAAFADDFPPVSPTPTPTPTVTPSCPIIYQYIDGQLVSGDQRIRLRLWNNPGHTDATVAFCDYQLTGWFQGSQGTWFTGTRTWDGGLHQIDYDFSAELLPGETIINWGINNIDSVCAGYCPIVVTYPDNPPQPTPTPTPTITPSVTPPPSPTPSATPAPSATPFPPAAPEAQTALTAGTIVNARRVYDDFAFTLEISEEFLTGPASIPMYVGNTYAFGDFSLNIPPTCFIIDEVCTTGCEPAFERLPSTPRFAVDVSEGAPTSCNDYFQYFFTLEGTGGEGTYFGSFEFIGQYGQLNNGDQVTITSFSVNNIGVPVGTYTVSNREEGIDPDNFDAIIDGWNIPVVATEEPADEFGYQYWRLRLDDDCVTTGSQEYIVRESIPNEFFLELDGWYYIAEDAANEIPNNNCYYVVDSLTREEAEAAHGSADIPDISNMSGPFTCEQCQVRKTP